MREREDIGDSFLLILYAQRHSCAPMFHRVVFRDKANKLYKRPKKKKPVERLELNVHKALRI